MLDTKKCTLIVVDVQGKLATLMHDNQSLFKNIQILIKAAKILDMPILWCQQCPEALGPTVPEIAELLTDNEPIDKTCFSCCRDAKFMRNLSFERPQILLSGIEAHVCICQTAADLRDKGFTSNVIADATSSRTLYNKQTALTHMLANGINIYSTEMALFELLKSADHPKFKQIAKLVK